jgi:hypothetical protein
VQDGQVSSSHKGDASRELRDAVSVKHRKRRALFCVEPSNNASVEEGDEVRRRTMRSEYV